MTIRRLSLAALACAGLLGAPLLAAGPAVAQTPAAPSTTRPAVPGAPAMTGGSGGMAMPSTGGAMGGAMSGVAMKGGVMGGAMKAANPAMGSLLNINTASASQLDSLPQIGKVRSEAIVKNRPYKSTDELVSKKVITQGIYDKIKSMITAG